MTDPYETWRATATCGCDAPEWDIDDPACYDPDPED